MYDSLETGERGSNFIAANGQIRDSVAARGIGNRGLGDIRANILGLDGSADQCRA